MEEAIPVNYVYLGNVLDGLGDFTISRTALLEKIEDILSHHGYFHKSDKFQFLTVKHLNSIRIKQINIEIINGNQVIEIVDDRYNRWVVEDKRRVAL